MPLIKKPRKNALTGKPLHRSIESEFQRWLTELHGKKGMTRVQIGQLRRTFYSGAFVLLSLQSDLAKAHSEEVAVAKMDVILLDLTTKIMEWNQ